jgi:hypothetical protein
LAIHVQEKSVDKRTGVLAGQSGWQWDRRQVEAASDIASQYADTIVWNGPVDGFLNSDFLDGVIHGLAYKDIVLLTEGTQFNWVPRVESGWFSAAGYRMPLFSDYSKTIRLNPDDETDGLGVIQLGTDVADPVFIAVYKRDAALKATPYKVWNVLPINMPFTGALDEETGERADAEPSDVPDAELMDLCKLEAKLDRDTGELVLNSPGVFSVGNSATDYESVAALWENHGESTAGRIIYTKYFPIVGDLTVVAWIEADEAFQTYTEVSDWSSTDASDFHYIVDRDLGIIYMSGYQPEPEYLGAAITAVSKSIGLKSSERVLSGRIPTSGKFVIDSETVAFNLFDTSRFSLLTRAAPTTHSAGAKIVFEPQGDWAGSDGDAATLYVAYEYGPRVDYEISCCQRRTANYNSWLDLHPLRRVASQGVLQLSTTAINVNSLVLETDATLSLGSSIYGPAYFGTSTTKLKATALDLAGNPVPDIEITIEILEEQGSPGVGRFNSGGKTYTGFSNLQGKIFAFYTAPLNPDDTELVFDETAFNIDGGNTTLSIPVDLTAVDLDQVYLFQVLKTDPYFGALGYKIETYTVGSDGGGNYIQVNSAVDEDLYAGGSLFANDLDLETESTIAVTKIVNSTILDGGEWNNYTKIYLESAVPAGYEDDPVWLLPQTAVRWDPEALNGSRVLAYYEDSGNYVPLFPDAFTASNDGVIYTGTELSLPSATDRDNNIGAYVAVIPRRVSFQAHCYDPASGRRIESNIIILILELPSSFIGSWTQDEDPQYGWRIGGSSEVASGLGGANFININPISSNINRLSLISIIPA